VRTKVTLPVFLLVASAAGSLAFPPAGVADAPTAYGWWYEANSGLPVAPPPPPSVPQNGLYIESGFNGPVAISALSFAIPSGDQIGPLVLHVAGSPVISQPPAACPLRSDSFNSTQDGQWSDRPAYDCAQAQVTGRVDSGQTTVTFDVSSLLRSGYVAVAILPEGPAESVSFDAPGADTLTVIAPNSESSAPGSASTVGPQGSVPSSGGSTGFGAPASGPFSTGVSPGAPSTSLGGPTAGSTALGQNAKGLTGPTQRFASAARGGLSPSGLAARVIGLAALAVLMVAWIEGYGVMGGRIKALASPLVKRRSDAT